MERLIDLKIGDRFKFLGEDEIYVFSYKVTEDQVAVIAEKDLRKEGKIKRFSSNLEVIPEIGK